MSSPQLITVVPLQEKLSYPPRQSEFTQTFWQGLRQGIWQTSGCDDCMKLTFPPKPVCPHCWSTKVSWRSLSSRGTLYSWTRIHAAPAAFASEAPYAVGIVDLDDGVRLACRLSDSEGINPQVGQRVEMQVLLYEDGALFAAKSIEQHL